MATNIPVTTTGGTFTDTSTNAEGLPVPDTYTFTSTIDPSVGTVSPDGTATFTGTPGAFDVTATDPLGLSGTASFEVADLVPAAVGEPVFTPA
jgi:hypothetical protein